MSASHGAVARQAAGAATHGWPERLVRVGIAARGVLYLIIGALALQVAFGSSEEEASKTGALHEVAEQPFGTFLLWVLAIGLVGYSLWQLAAAAFGPVADPSVHEPKDRLKALIEGALYGAVAIAAIGIATGSGGSGSQSETWTAKVLAWPAGPFLVGLAGAAILGGGLYLIYEGWKAKFTDELELGRLSPTGRRAVVQLGRFGRVARGFAFAMIGGLVISAAVDYDASQASGLDGALKTLAAQPYGPWLLALVAIGLVAYGVYCVVESRLRRVG